MLYEENSKEVLRAKEIGIRQFDNNEDDIKESSIVYFLHDNVAICNPFMDPAGKKSFTLKESYAEYGENNVNNFIEKCNKSCIKN